MHVCKKTTGSILKSIKFSKKKDVYITVDIALNNHNEIVNFDNACVLNKNKITRNIKKKKTL